MIKNYKEFILNEIRSDELTDLTTSDRIERSSIVEHKLLKVKKRKGNLRTRTVIFETWTKGKDKKYQTSIELTDYKKLSKLKKDTIQDRVEVLLEEGDIKVSCTCPDYLYAGYKYIGTQLDYSIDKENRSPDVRNPNQDGSICKHIHKVLEDINQYIPDISKQIQ